MGSVGRLLADRFDYVGVEPDPVSYAAAAKRIGVRGCVLNCAVEDLPVEGLFDILCAFEVLEHLEDDRGALSEWLRHLRPGGLVLVSVPSGPSRFGLQDEYVGHYRRYDRASLAALLGDAEVRELELVSYGFPLANLLELSRNQIARRRPASSSLRTRTEASGRWLQPPDWAAVATQAITSPFRRLQRASGATNLGTGLIARGRFDPGG